MDEKLRKCQGCKETKPRSELIKITKLQNNLLKINPKTNEFGRSMYICKNIDCIKKVIKKSKIKTVLKYSDLNEIQRVEKELIGLFCNNC